MSVFSNYLKRTDVYIEALWTTLCIGLKRFVEEAGHDQLVVGLSGGLDSAVVACLGAAAVPPTHVTAISMPSPFSSAGSVRDAQALAENIGIRFIQLPIDHALKACEESLSFVYKDELDGVPHENLQARIRGMFLMAHANARAALVLATGNKSEAAIGYSTLYGDTVGAIAPIGDVVKTDVYALARYVNRDAELIPRSILVKPPSAELRPDQKDSDELPPYEILDYIIRRCVEEGADPTEVMAAGVPDWQVEEILDKIEEMEFKREQCPPALCVSEGPFGDGPICVLKV